MSMSRNVAEILPLEIWVQCIAEACDGEHYMADLLTLTLLSKRLCHYLIINPSLWTTIHVNDTDQDSAATIALFLHLSGALSLSLMIWVPLSRDWESIYPMLLQHTTRIGEITLQTSHRSHSVGCSLKDTIVDGDINYSMRRILHDLASSELPQFLDVDVGRPVEMDADLVPSNLISTGDWLIPLESAKSELLTLITQHLSIKVNHLPYLLRHSRNLKCLRQLHIQSDDEDYIRPPLPLAKGEYPPYLPTLDILRYRGRFSPAFEQLISSSAQNIRILDIHIGILDLKSALHVIETCTTLVRLSLTLLLLDYDIDTHNKRRAYKLGSINEWSRDAKISKWSSQGLKHFKCEVTPFGRNKKRQKRDKINLWNCFYDIFPKLHSLHWHLPTENLEAPSESKVVSDLIQYSASCTQPFMPPLGFTFTQLHSLTLEIGKSVGTLWNMDPQDFPVMRILSITLLGVDTEFQLLDFPSLMEISISTRLRTFPQGMAVCISLFCNPHICPCLEQMTLDTFIEWDILYLSLRRRNLLQSTNISPIKRLGLPAVPRQFRSVFVSLLAGQEVLPLSSFLYSINFAIQDSQTHFCDGKREGCLSCVLLELSHCSEPLQPSKLPKKYHNTTMKPRAFAEVIKPFGLFPPLTSWEFNFGDVSITERDWMDGITQKISEWKHVAYEWSRLHHRTLMCHRQRCRPLATITKDDGIFEDEWYDAIRDGLLRFSELQNAPDNSTHLIAMRTLADLVKQGDIFNNTISEIIPKLFSLVIGMVQSDNQSEVTSTLLELAKYKDLRILIRDHIPQLFRLEERGFDAIVELAKYGDLRIAIHDCIPELFRLERGPDVVVELAMYDDLRITIHNHISQLLGLKSNGLNAVVELAVYGDLRITICDHIPQLLTLEPGGLDAVVKLAKYDDLRFTIRDCIPQLLTLKSGGLDAVVKLAMYDDLQIVIRDYIPRLAGLERGLDTVAKLAMYGDLRITIHDCIPEIFRLRHGSLDAVLKLAKYDDLRITIRGQIPRFITSKWGDLDTVVKLAKYEDLRIAIRDCIPQIFRLKEKGLDAIKELAKYGSFRVTIRGRIPQLLTLKRGGLDAVVKLAKYEDLRISIRDCIPEIFRLRERSLDAVVKLAKYDDLRISIRDHIPQLITSELGGLDVVVELAKYDDLRVIISSCIPRIFALWDERSPKYIEVAIIILVRLAEHLDLRVTIRGELSRLSKVLGNGHTKAETHIVIALVALNQSEGFHDAIGPFSELFKDDNIRIQTWRDVFKFRDNHSATIEQLLEGEYNRKRRINPSLCVNK